MPITRKEFEFAVVALWPRTDTDLVHDELYGGLRALRLIARCSSALYEDIATLIGTATERRYLPTHHRLLAAFPRPAGRA